MVTIHAQSGVILEGAGLQGLFNGLNNNIRFYVLDIFTQNMLQEIDRVFDMNSLALIFSERHLNLLF